MASKCYDDSFNNWLDGKVNFTIYEGLPVPENGLNKPIPYSNGGKLSQQEATQSLLQEFETVLEDVEACHQMNMYMYSTLTPPQSPPEKTMNNDCNSFFPVETLQETFNYVSPSENSLNLMTTTKPPIVPVSDQWNVQMTSLPINMVNDLSVMDEYVCSVDRNPLSPRASSNSSFLSTEDSSDAQMVTGDVTPINYRSIPVRSRSKVYMRSTTEDRKVRKKEQNKNAATRYRQKKKQEITEIIGEEQELARHNQQLRSKVVDLQREISYLKSLMRDLFRAKGLLT